MPFPIATADRILPLPRNGEKSFRWRRDKLHKASLHSLSLSLSARLNFVRIIHTASHCILLFCLCVDLYPHIEEEHIIEYGCLAKSMDIPADVASHSAATLTFERVPDAERRAFQATLYPIFEEDEKNKGLTIPQYNYRSILVAAKKSDGTVVGAFRAETGWNELHVVLLAVNPDCRVRGTGTALMQYAEHVARTQLGCHRMRVDVFDWQPRAFFEDMGFSVFGVQEDFPHGHTRYLLQKVWGAEPSAAPMHGYARAATDLTIDTWDDPEGEATLQKWYDSDTVARTAASPHPVHAATPSYFALKVSHSNGTFAAGVALMVVWNELHINLLAVAPSGQRRGVGTAILAKLNEVAREHHCDCIGLETSGWQGRPFYERNGFTCFSTQHGVPEGFERFRLVRRVPSE